jgi:hypothetical protein
MNRALPTVRWLAVSASIARRPVNRMAAEWGKEEQETGKRREPAKFNPAAS